jgi:uncharacterized protein YdaU (DUF1376 family)
MAKDLTYFKFVVSEWNDGDITTCSFAAQGLFANLCSLYWSREGDLSMEKARKKFKNASEKLWNELKTEKVFREVEGKLVIKFLDEQLTELVNTSKQNSHNAKLRWEQRKQDAPASVSQCATPESAKHLEYSIVDKSIVDKKNTGAVAPVVEIPFEGETLNAWNEWEQYRKEKKQKLTPSTRKKQIQSLVGRAGPEIIAMINQSITKGWTGLFEINSNGKTNNGRHTKSQIRRADAVIEQPKDYGEF